MKQANYLPIDRQELHTRTEQKNDPYIGDIMTYCPNQPFDFKNSYAVIVSGASWTPCGHMLLNTGGRGGWYFHIAERQGKPRFMRESTFYRYLREHNKQELRRRRLTIPNPDAAHKKLEELLAKQWTWFVLPNNCASFVEDIVRAGGSSAGLYFNCPTKERFI